MSAIVKSFGILWLTTASTILISGCGQRICVGGFGQCAIQIQEKSGTPVVGNEQFGLTASRSEIYEGERTEIRSVNSNADWKMMIMDGPGSIEGSGPSAVFIAPISVTASSIFTKLKGWDPSRYKTDRETPLAFDTIMIEIKQKE